MSYREEKTENGTDIVFDGWETGIASSPHKGIANIQNGNISTESGEIVASFVRAQQTLQSTATGIGNLSYLSTDHVNLSISGTNNKFKGNWINVTNSSNTTQLPNGTYYVPPSTGAGFKLANYYKVSATAGGAQNAQILVIGGGSGGGSYTGSGTGGSGGGGAGGFQYNAAVSVSQSINTIIVGAGGAHGDATSSYVGYSGTSSMFNTIISTGGGGGGSNAAQAGLPGGSGGGAGNSTGTTVNGGTGTVGQGNNGGNSTSGTFGAGGGGGSSAVGGNGTAGPTGGNGGNGTANSISGSAITYAGGGGGGSGTSGTGGTGGTGGGGAGSSGSGNGTNATVNTGGGGGGSGRGASGSGFIGGNGGSGIVVISFPTGIVTNPTTAGGTYTTSGGRDIFTFSTVGTFIFAPTYANVPAPSAFLTGFTAGLTANFTLVHILGNPIAKATETYFNNGTTYNRYYILDNQNLIWAYDTINETLYTPSDNVNWFLPDYQTSWCTNATGIAVIDGFLVAAAQSGIYGKAVVDLGGTNTQTTTWTAFAKNVPWNGGAANSPHFCYTGHQGRLYITDGNYIRSYFPDSTLITSVAGVTADNVQSLASWIVDSTRTPAQGYGAIASPISGSEPFTSDEKGLPVVFFSDGTLPNSINANQVYYLKRDGNDFTVYADPTMNDVNNSVTFTTMPVSGATNGTLTGPWTFPTGYYYTAFFNAGGQEYRNVLFTNGSTTAIWSPALTVNTNNASVNAYGVLDISTGAVGTQYYATFAPIYSVASPYPGFGTVGTSLSALSTQRLTLPTFEVAQCMAEIGNNIVVGCKGNVVYPWGQQSNLPDSIISLPEGNVVNILTVNQVAYMFAGNQGNVYITDGSLASLVVNIPDYIAGIPGSPGTYIESTYYWGDAMYLRGRVYFSVLDQNATKVGNAGGIWSFYPTQNISIDQDTGTALRLEAKNSYNTYNGYDTLLIRKELQDAEEPLYWSAWNSNINTPTYGIDYSTNGTSSSFPTLVETDAAPVGTMLSKKTFTQTEFKLSAPLDLNARVSAEYRVNTTDVWSSIPQFQMERNRLSGVSSINFEKSQWLQFRITLTPATLSDNTNSFVRLKEFRLR